MEARGKNTVNSAHSLNSTRGCIRTVAGDRVERDNLARKGITAANVVRTGSEQPKSTTQNKINKI